MKHSAAVAILGCLFSVATVQAGGLLLQLPADGSSVQYDGTVKFTYGESKGEFKATIIVRSVGREVVNGVPCRWIEIERIVKLDPERVDISKLLFSEKAITRGADPEEELIKGWFQFQGIKELETFSDPAVAELPAFLFKELENRKELAPIRVKTPLGELNCPGIRGTGSFEQGDGRIQMKWTQELRSHDRVPFGMAYSHFQIEYRIDNGDTDLVVKIDMTLELEKVGKNAKSALPEYGLSGPEER